MSLPKSYLELKSNDNPELKSDDKIELKSDHKPESKNYGCNPELKSFLESIDDMLFGSSSPQEPQRCEYTRPLTTGPGSLSSSCESIITATSGKSSEIFSEKYSSCSLASQKLLCHEQSLRSPLNLHATSGYGLPVSTHIHYFHTEYIISPKIGTDQNLLLVRIQVSRL